MQGEKKGLDRNLLQEAKARKIEREREEKMAKEAAAYVGLDEPQDKPWTKFGRDIVHWACWIPKKDKPRRIDVFVPGRMTFSYNLGFRGDGDELEYVGSSDLPVPVLQSRAEVRGYVRHLQAARDDAVLRDICLAIHSKPNTSSKKRSKPVKWAGVVEVAEEVAEEEDIFADVGRDYELVVEKKDSASEKKHVATQYFGREIVNGKLIDTAKEEEAMRRQVSVELKRVLESVKAKPTEGGLKRSNGIYDDDGFSDEDFSDEDGEVGADDPKKKVGADEPKKKKPRTRKEPSK